MNFAFGEGDLQKQILFDINMEVATGEIVLLTGPSGSGKTTLLTLIGPLRKVRDGELDVLNHHLHDASLEELVEVRREIGFIFQQHNLLPFLTARQNVQLMFHLHPEVRPDEASRLTAELLTSVGLGHRLDYYPARLSGGQKSKELHAGTCGQSEVDSGRRAHSRIGQSIRSRRRQSSAGTCSRARLSDSDGDSRPANSGRSRSHHQHGRRSSPPGRKAERIAIPNMVMLGPGHYSPLVAISSTRGRQLR